MGLELSPTTTITSNRSPPKLREDTQTREGSSTPAASAAWGELSLGGRHAGTRHRSHHGHSLLPEGDALSKADVAGLTCGLGSPEARNAAAARTGEMLTSKFLT